MAESFLADLGMVLNILFAVVMAIVVSVCLEPYIDYLAQQDRDRDRSDKERQDYAPESSLAIDVPPITTEQPPIATEKPPITTEKPPIITAKPPITTAQSSLLSMQITQVVSTAEVVSREHAKSISPEPPPFQHSGAASSPPYYPGPLQNNRGSLHHFISASSSANITARNAQASPLLRLPGELRNKIFEYALSEPIVGCFVHRTNDGKSLYRLHARCEDTWNNEEMNQMKYTCRQLHDETRGLGLEWNAIRFPPYEGPGLVDAASVTCAGFLENCSSNRIACLKDIEVFEKVLIARPIPFFGRTMSHELFDYDGVRRLAILCGQQPDIKIKLVLEYFKFVCSPKLPFGGTCGFLSTISRAITVASAFRKLTPEIAVGHPFLDYHLSMCVRGAHLWILPELLRCWPGYGLEAPPLPVNLRAVPAVPFPVLEAQSWLALHMDPVDPEAAECIIEKLRTWFENGF